MSDDAGMTRARFLRLCGAAAAASAAGREILGAPATPADAPEPVSMRSWELAEFPAAPRNCKRMVKITATNGAFGVAPTLDSGGKGLKDAEEILKKSNLLDHETLYDVLIEKQLASTVVKIVDIACWDLHARMLRKPLHALLGTTKTKIVRYGDVRGTQPDFSPKRYAESVARYFESTGLSATKLHFPGAMGTADSISFQDALETLRAVREAVGPEKILAWDPYPRSAESATHSVDEAKDILRVMDELRYAWIEGPLPPVPFETQIHKYVELMKVARLRIQAEGPGSPIGDGTPFEVMARWVEAGAVNQCSSDAYVSTAIPGALRRWLDAGAASPQPAGAHCSTGLTNVIRILEYARLHPERPLTINLHWCWAPHAHLAMAYDDAIFPCAEFPFSDELPARCLAKTHLLAPDWPGIYPID
jgi:hypothetical protein